MKQNSLRIKIKQNEQNKTERNETDKRKQNETKYSKINSSNDNIYIASGVAQNKKVRVRALGRGARSKSKLPSPHKLSVTGNSLMHSLRVCGGKWQQRTVSVLELVPNFEIFAWKTGTSLHLMEKKETGLGVRAVLC